MISVNSKVPNLTIYFIYYTPSSVSNLAMDTSRENPFDKDESRLEEVSEIKKWVTLKLKELENQNFMLKEENRKVNEELNKLKECYAKKSYTPETRRRFNKRNIYMSNNRYFNKPRNYSQDAASSSSDEEFFVTKSKLSFAKNDATTEERHQPAIEGDNIRLLSGNSRVICSSRSGSLDRKLTKMKKLNFSRMKKQVRERECGERKASEGSEEEREKVHKPPTPPLHRCPSWESRIYAIANHGIKSAISTPVQDNQHFGSFKRDPQELFTEFDFYDCTFPIFKNNNGRLVQLKTPRSSFIKREESMSSDLEGDKTFGYFKSSTTSSGNESDFASEAKLINLSLHGSDSEDDYAIPPDVFNPSMDSLKICEDLPKDSEIFNPNDFKLEKAGYLFKLSGKFKVWKRRWFVLKDGALCYYKDQSESVKNKAKEQKIFLDRSCKLVKCKDCTFQLCNRDGKKMLHLSADSTIAYNDWITLISQSLTLNSILQLQENQVPIIESYLVKVRFGHSLRCWVALYGHYLVYFNNSVEKIPFGFTDLKDAQFQEINLLSDVVDFAFLFDENSKKNGQYSISIHAKDDTEPIYLLFSSKQDFSLWNHHLKITSSDEPSSKTAFENFLTLLLNIESSSNSKEEFYQHQVWNNPLLVLSKQAITEPLTKLSTDALKTEAIKLFKSIQLFTSVPIDLSAIDYHVSLVQDSLKVCFDNPELQAELYFQLIKQSTPEVRCSELSPNSVGMHRSFWCSPQSIFKCETSPNERTSPSGPEPSEEIKRMSAAFLQCFKFLAITVSIFLPQNQVLWLLKHHLNRSKDASSELGKYAFYCERAMNRVLSNGPRKQSPSRMEVLSILQRNPYQHSLPHSIPVHFANQSYQVIGFDGSTTIAEFTQSLNLESGIRDNIYSGFALFSDDPINEDVEHLLNLNCKLADIIAHWEANLRKYHLGKFENTKAIRLMYKHRLCLKRYFKTETDKERLLWVYEINNEIIQNRFPVTIDLAVQLASLMIQIECGDCQDYTNLEAILDRVLLQFLPAKFIETSLIKQMILQKWNELGERSVLDCVRIYLNCTRKWDLCGSKLFEAKVSNMLKYDDLTSLYLCKIFSQSPLVWLSVTDEYVVLVEINTFRPLLRMPHHSIINFGGYRSHFMLVVKGNKIEKYVSDTQADALLSKITSAHDQRLFFTMSKRKIIEITMLLADYINIIHTQTT